MGCGRRRESSVSESASEYDDDPGDTSAASCPSSMCTCQETTDEVVCTIQLHIHAALQHTSDYSDLLPTASNADQAFMPVGDAYICCCQAAASADAFFVNKMVHACQETSRGSFVARACSARVACT